MEFEKLKKVLANNNKPILFLGAGASMSSNGLSAFDITSFILQDFYHSQENQKIKYLFEQDYECEANFENVMDKIYKTENDRKKVVENYLDQLDLSEGYRYLAILLKLGYFYPIVLTTNHETLIEKCIIDDNLIEKKKKVVSLVQQDLTKNYINIEEDTIYIIHLHGSFLSSENIQVTSKTTFSLSENCKQIVSDLCDRYGLIIVGYGYQDVDVRNLLQTMDSMSKGCYFISYGVFNQQGQAELIKMLQYHNSEKNIIENCSFDSFFIDLGKEAYCAYQREKGEKEIEELYELLDKTRCFFEARNKNLSNMKIIVEELYQKYKVDEILALKEFIYYEINKNGEIYRLRQGIKYLENSIFYYNSFTKSKYLCKLKYYLLNEYLNLFLLGDNILENKIEYLDKIIEMGDSCVKRLKKSEPRLVIKFQLLIGEALKEKAMLNENPTSQKNNVNRARDILQKVIDNICDDLEYYLGIAYRHLAVTYELESDLLQNNMEREKCIDNWKKYSIWANEFLEKFNENTVRGYATMNIAASNVAMLQIHSKEEYKKQLIEEGLEYLQKSIKLHEGMEEYRGVAWSNIHKCKLLRLKIKNCYAKENVNKLISEMEDSANIAINNILRTDDLLGKGLAYQQLGIALSLYDEYMQCEADIKLESAIFILQKSVDILKNTGFFRGLTDSCIWVSKILYKKWKKTGDMMFFIKAYKNLNIGFISACENLSLESRIEIMYEQLRIETNKIVELI